MHGMMGVGKVWVGFPTIILFYVHYQVGGIIQRYPLSISWTLGRGLVPSKALTPLCPYLHIYIGTYVSQAAALVSMGSPGHLQLELDTYKSCIPAHFSDRALKTRFVTFGAISTKRLVRSNASSSNNGKLSNLRRGGRVRVKV